MRRPHSVASAPSGHGDGRRHPHGSEQEQDRKGTHVTPDLGRPGEEAAYRFADRHVDSFAAWDLLVFLHNRPDTIEDVAGYAMLLGRSEEDLARSLDQLVGTGALSAIDEGVSPRYCLTRDDALREDLAAFVDLCTVKECRLEIVRRVLAGYPRD